MTVEIELKFIATPSAMAALPELITRCGGKNHELLALSNTYFDTAENFLRSHHIGLRIRGCNNAYEMTLKSAGSTVGGIAHRAEYNIDLPTNQLDLSLLPADVWPEKTEIAELQNNLSPLFSTDFTRNKWLINFQQSQIEIALDQGMIKAGSRNVPISELEMELKQGNAADMLALAQQLTAVEGLRLESQSKAARGYRLLSNEESLPKIEMTVLKLSEKATVQQGLEAALEWALSYWQRNEERWFENDKQAQHGVAHALVAIRQILVIFGGIIPRKATTALRERLLTLEQQLEIKKDASEVCLQPDYLQLKLALMSWLLNKGWMMFVDQKGQKKLSDSFKRFSDVMLSRCRSELKEAFNKPLTHEGYHDQQPRLERQIISFYLLSGAYSEEQSRPYIEGWQMLFNAQGDRDYLRRSAMEQPLFWLNSSQHT